MRTDTLSVKKQTEKDESLWPFNIKFKLHAYISLILLKTKRRIVYLYNNGWKSFYPNLKSHFTNNIILNVYTKSPYNSCFGRACCKNCFNPTLNFKFLGLNWISYWEFSYLLFKTKSKCRKIRKKKYIDLKSSKCSYHLSVLTLKNRHLLKLI